MNRRLTFVLLSLLVCSLSFAAVERREPSRFDRLEIFDAVSRLGIAAEAPEAIPDFGNGAAAWTAFRSRHAGDWRVRIDRRSGVPILVEGSGIPWFDAEGPTPTLDALEARARELVAEEGIVFRVRGAELVLNREASWIGDAGRGLLAFDRVVDGVPVEGERFLLHLVRGRLVSFGADRWGAIDRAPEARYGIETARSLLFTYMGVTPSDAVENVEDASLVLTAAPPELDPTASRWTGPVGRGIAFRLAWKIVIRVAGEPGTWVGKVDATTGEILALYDDDKYEQAKGSVYPTASDGLCAENGCLVADFPMPYASISTGSGPIAANDVGMFECAGGGSSSTQLSGPYVLISDACGAVNESTTCGDDLDLGPGVAGATNCTVQAGRSAGDTHASRSGFYTINRIKEKARYFLPANGWLQTQLRVNVNVNSTCNAGWGSGQLSMYRAGNGCRNTAETAGVLNHEFGHGLDQNDGGGYDNASESYADVTAILSDRSSCVGRGFYESGTCSGYGDTCLSCTGIRDMDYAARQANTPATPSGFTANNCGSGSGPCGREVHCESYVSSEAMFDLATRDLPAAGMDAKTAWQKTESLFYRSRQGSGGNIFNCSLPSSDGCNVNGWYNTIRIADDDDGNLANGTPHAAAIFAAFNRHKIACGAVGDPSNQSHSSCPSLAKPVAAATAGSNAVSLSWPSVANAASYLVLRNEVSCDFTQNVVATVAAPGNTYVDSDLPNGTAFFYRIQAVGTNGACESAVSDCVQATPQPFAGTVKFDKGAYACSAVLALSVTDANVGASTVSVDVSSTTEPTPETLTLTETSPGSSKFVASIQGTGGASSHGDGMLALQNGDVLTATYVDADDGMGGSGLPRQANAVVDCAPPQISGIQTSGVTDVHANVGWTTDEGSTSVVHWGDTIPPANTASTAGLPTGHSVPLNGLQSCTVYYYSVESQDAPGNVATDDRSGQYYAFETLGNFGAGLQPCRAGKISLGSATYGCSSSVAVSLVDLDLNTDTGSAQTVVVRVSSSTEPYGESIVLTETGANTSVFAGSIATSAAAPVAGNGVLEAATGDLLTATYDDASAGTGVPAVSFATAVADCSGPVDSNLRVTGITDDGATIEWNTSEPSDARVEWGTTPALGNVVTNGSLTTSHALTIGPFAECGRIYFRAFSTDVYGNPRTYDAAGSPFALSAYRTPGIFRDEFESPSAWTLQGEWQIDAPQGKGSSPGDPTTAFTPSKVLGLDLTGLGAKPGDYELNSDTRAISPVLNGSSLIGAKVIFRRWLNVGGGGIAYVEVFKNGAWNSVWTSGVGGVTDTAWSRQTVDLSQFADGNASLQIAFRIRAGFSQTSNRAGWNLDRVVVKGSDTPDFVGCGGCGGAPTFAGAQSAADVNACADTGTTLSWKAAPTWGSGSTGKYAVYRSTDPAFVPSPANLVMAGIAGTSYTDTGAPNGTTLYYVVRAENDETCSTGPANGGVTDANLVRLSARDDVSQPDPGDVGSTLGANPVNEAHVRLTWAVSPTAARYRIYRAQSPQGPYTAIAETAGTLWEDKDQLGDSANRYYRVVPIDACGNE